MTTAYVAALGYEEASAATSLSHDELKRAIEQGLLKAKSRGRRVLFTPAALEEYIDSLPDIEPKAVS